MSAVRRGLHVTLTYALEVDGREVERCGVDRPLSFVNGGGRLLPSFEAALEGLEEGEAFDFTLPPGEAYGEVEAGAVADVPIGVFGGHEELLCEGARVPMRNGQGRTMTGTVRSVGPATVTVDFNHPMAGKTLHFTGRVVAVREATADELMPPDCGGGCHGGDCGGCHNDCDRGRHDDGGCGGCCH